MKLEKDMYVRTYNGKIRKILSLSFDSRWKSVFIDTHTWLKEEYVAKSSYNIIDLIEIGDHVNGYLVTTADDNVGSIYIDLKDNNGLRTKLYNNDIKTILTKEQFEKNCYKVN